MAKWHLILTSHEATMKGKMGAESIQHQVSRLPGCSKQFRMCFRTAMTPNFFHNTQHTKSYYYITSASVKPSWRAFLVYLHSTRGQFSQASLLSIFQSNTRQVMYFSCVQFCSTQKAQSMIISEASLRTFTQLSFYNRCYCFQEENLLDWFKGTSSIFDLLNLEESVCTNEKPSRGLELKNR